MVQKSLNTDHQISMLGGCLLRFIILAHILSTGQIRAVSLMNCYFRSSSVKCTVDFIQVTGHVVRHVVTNFL